MKLLLVFLSFCSALTLMPNSAQATGKLPLLNGEIITKATMPLPGFQLCGGQYLRFCGRGHYLIAVIEIGLSGHYYFNGFEPGPYVSAGGFALAHLVGGREGYEASIGYNFKKWKIAAGGRYSRYTTKYGYSSMQPQGDISISWKLK